MIKVNLAKTHNYASGGTQTSLGIDGGGSTSAPGDLQPHVKIFLLLIATICLYGYQSYNISRLRKKLVIKQNIKNEIAAEKAELASVTNVVDGLSKERARLDGQLSTLQRISQKRAYKLRTIQLVQQSILEDLWLKEMLIKDSTLVFKGFSRSPSSVQEIVSNLSSVDFIKSAFNKELTRKTVKNDIVNGFEIVAEVKN